jgi:hypothetical protein
MSGEVRRHFEWTMSSHTETKGNQNTKAFSLGAHRYKRTQSVVSRRV